MKVLFRYSLISLLIVLTGCPSASAPKIPNNVKADTTRIDAYHQASCCIDITKAVIEQVKYSGSLSVSMEENANRLLLSTGPTFYKVIAIPESDKREYYFLRSFITEESGTKSAFIPIVATLNQDFSLSRHSTFQHFDFNHWTVWGQQEHLSMQIKVDRNSMLKKYA